MTAKRPAVFLDRDGTLIADVPYVGDPAQVRLLPGSADAVRRLRQAGFTCVVVSNQSAVGRGMITLDQMHAVQEEMVRQLTAAGAALDGNYWCIYAPQTTEKTVIEHVDRKPGPGMLLRAARDLNLDLANSWIIGDQVSDMLAGRNAGCRGGILVRSGQDVALALGYLGNSAIAADHLAAAAAMILNRAE
jgi:D-glycero-D-manno-heptose 1,7-bisphosphate phosphatase